MISIYVHIINNNLELSRQKRLQNRRIIKPRKLMLDFICTFIENRYYWIENSGYKVKVIVL